MNIDELMGTVKTTTDNLDSSPVIWLTLFTRSRGKGTIGQLLMDSTYLTVPIANAIEITSDLKEMVEDMRTGTIGQLLVDTTRLKVPIDNAIRVTNDLQQIVESIRKGEGLAGRLIADSAAALSIDSALINMIQVTENLKLVTAKAKKSFLLWGF